MNGTMTWLFLTTLPLAVGAPATAQEPPKTFDAAKKRLAKTHEDIDHLVTLYCKCPYERAGKIEAKTGLRNHWILGEQ